MKTALVTGANRGIGFAIAKALAKREIRVLLASRDFEAGRQAAEEIGNNVTPVELDLLEAKILNEQIHKIKDDHPQIDILINNAGVLEQGDLLEVDVSDFLSSMKVNFEGPFHLIRSIVPDMIKNNYGRVVNLSSGWGSFADGLSGPAAYSVSKASINALTLSLAHSIGTKNVKINSMCPGWVRTRMGGQSASRSPEEGAETAVWLATLDDDGPTGGFFRDKRLIEW